MNRPATDCNMGYDQNPQFSPDGRYVAWSSMERDGYESDRTRLCVLDRNSQALKLLQRLRDEAHRFGITHHRARRSKSQISSALREIKGVGERTEQRLLLRFGSVAGIVAAPVEEISELVGPALAARIKDELK